MGFDETQTIILATISGVDESNIIESTMTDAEKRRVFQAAQILAKYEKNLYIWRMPDPNIKQLISGVRKMRLTHNLDNRNCLSIGSCQSWFQSRLLCLVSIHPKL